MGMNPLIFVRTEHYSEPTFGGENWLSQGDDGVFFESLMSNAGKDDFALAGLRLIPCDIDSINRSIPISPEQSQ